MRPHLVFEVRAGGEKGEDVLVLTGVAPGSPIADAHAPAVPIRLVSPREDAFKGLLAQCHANRALRADIPAVGTDHIAVADPALFPLAHALDLERREATADERCSMATTACYRLWGSNMHGFTCPGVAGVLARACAQLLERRFIRARRVGVLFEGAVTRCATALLHTRPDRLCVVLVRESSELEAVAVALEQSRFSDLSRFRAPVVAIRPCASAAASVIEQAFGFAFEPIFSFTDDASGRQEDVLEAAAAIELIARLDAESGAAMASTTVEFGPLRIEATVDGAVFADEPIDVWFGSAGHAVPRVLATLRALRAATPASDSSLAAALEVCMKGGLPPEATSEDFVVRTSWFLARFCRERDPLFAEALASELERVRLGTMSLDDLLREAVGTGLEETALLELLGSPNNTLSAEIGEAHGRFGWTKTPPGKGHERWAAFFESELAFARALADAPLLYEGLEALAAGRVDRGRGLLARQARTEPLPRRARLALARSCHRGELEVLLGYLDGLAPDPEVLLIRATTLLDLGRAGEAKAVVAGALEVPHPDIGAVYHLLSRCDAALGDGPRGLRSILLAAAHLPNERDMLREAGNVARANGALELSQRIFEHLAALGSALDRALLADLVDARGDSGRARVELDRARAAAKDPSERAKVDELSGFHHWRQGELAAALDDAAAAIAVDPSRGLLRELRARILLDMGRFADATLDLEIISAESYWDAMTDRATRPFQSRAQVLDAILQCRGARIEAAWPSEILAAPGYNSPLAHARRAAVAGRLGEGLRLLLPLLSAGTADEKKAAHEGIRAIFEVAGRGDPEVEALRREVMMAM